MAYFLRLPAFLFLSVALVVVALWAWMGWPVAMPPSPLAAGEKLPCVSYAPFRDGQSPLDRSTIIPEAQIDEDLAQLSKITSCVRTYAVELGLDKVAPLARKHGLKVLQGIWLGSDQAKNKQEIDAGIALARAYPDTISALVVGNEVMLRGELSAADISAILKDVKARAGGVDVTYADVWEFWERAKALAGDVDFVTVHILPYWEDLPVSAAEAGRHIDHIRQHVADQFPGKEILIGETGWPSAGRMREGALPSLSDQALVMHEVVRLAKEKGYRVNVIEAFDQPWKRRNEGTVGGHWGLIDAGSRQQKFHWGQPVSDHPRWVIQGLAGVVLAGAAFGSALWAARRAARTPSTGEWIGVAVIALAGGATIGGTLSHLPLESLGWVGWTRNSAFLALSLAATLAIPALMASGTRLHPLAFALNGGYRRGATWGTVVGASLLALTLLAVGETALELVFDPRYKDFPYFPLTPPVLAMLTLCFVRPPVSEGSGMAEQIALFGLLAAGIYVPLNETLQNWQAAWFGLLSLALALTVWRVRGGRGRG
ncbi:beta-1,6-glucan synthase [Aquabacter sp. L1I39]|uniref:glycoside hydrolase family 17 protein n=1 Tax=Aquabacter sp. L1I39 TaxID=2820278 RepID=UPI001ADD3A4D|nr:beta-1,6-glucan synthase [Aquabacter sp. L1I39]QTL03606.1 beta-1,6-glucan synthase [Aquabacter sp. L1I39]